jgi:hypothetical protein
MSFFQLIKLLGGYNSDKAMNIQNISQFLKADRLLFVTFSNVPKVFRIYLTIPANNCEGKGIFRTCISEKPFAFHHMPLFPYIS